MANMVQFNLVSPERRLASLEASEIQIPGADGDLTAMAGHSPTITTLRPGILRAVSANGVQAYAVTGGFAEISGASVSVLAERAVPLADVTDALMDEFIAAARAKGESSSDKGSGDKYASDLQALRAAVNV